MSKYLYSDFLLIIVNSKSIVRIEGKIENESCSTTWVDKKKQFLNIEPKNSPLGSKKIKDDPKIKSKLKVRIEGNIENESCLTTWVDPKTVVKPCSDPQTSPLGPHKTKTAPKLSQIQMSEVKES